MPRTRSELERAAGLLISNIQAVWHEEAGEPKSASSETVMHKSHGLLAAAKTGSLAPELAGATIGEYLGTAWVAAHPQVWPAIKSLEHAARSDA